jgi:hypothetical protein
MVGSKNRNHHRNYSFRVVEITFAHKIQSNVCFTPNGALGGWILDAGPGRREATFGIQPGYSATGALRGPTDTFAFADNWINYKFYW